MVLEASKKERKKKQLQIQEKRCKEENQMKGSQNLKRQKKVIMQKEKIKIIRQGIAGKKKKKSGAE